MSLNCVECYCTVNFAYLGPSSKKLQTIFFRDLTGFRKKIVDGVAYGHIKLPSY